MSVVLVFFFFFQAEDGIRDLVRSRGLGDVYKRQTDHTALFEEVHDPPRPGEADLELALQHAGAAQLAANDEVHRLAHCLLYTSDAADERSSVDLGGRRIIKKKNKDNAHGAEQIKEIMKKANNRIEQ